MHLTGPDMEAFVIELLAADRPAEDPKQAESFTSAWQRACLIATIHATERYPGTVVALAQAVEVAAPTVRRYISGVAAPHWGLRHTVLNALGLYLSKAVAHYQAEAERSSAQLRAFNMLIQQPGFDGDTFLKRAQATSINEAIEALVKGDS